MSEPVTLNIALGKHDHVKPLKDGRVASPRIRFVFHEYEPLPKAFRAMIRGTELDVSEMAVVNHLLAHDFAKPLTAIAIPLWNRLPHVNLVCPTGSALEGPKDLEGKMSGVRAYGQTSGVWVRGVLASEYGVDLEQVRWLTMEDAHVPEYVDPPICTRNTTGRGLRDLLNDGTLISIMGEREVDPSGIRTVIPDAEQAALAWIARTEMIPVNHILTVRKSVLADHPWLGGELMELFEDARRISVEEGAEPPPEYGLEANRRSMELLK
eukprot:gene2087-2124_t